jgi:hypothetical protein
MHMSHAAEGRRCLPWPLPVKKYMHDYGSAHSAGAYLVGLDANGLLITRTSLTPGPFDPVYTGLTPMRRVRVASDGTLYGVGTDYKLYTRTSLHTDWVLVPGDTCCITDIAEHPDGMLLGIGLSGSTGRWEEMRVRNSLAAPAVWTPTVLGCCISSVTVLRDGRIMAAGSHDMHLFYKKSHDGIWQRMDDSVNCCVKDFMQLPDGSFLGISKTNELMHKRVLTDGWSSIANGVASITHSLPTGERVLHALCCNLPGFGACLAMLLSWLLRPTATQSGAVLSLRPYHALAHGMQQLL